MAEGFNAIVLKTNRHIEWFMSSNLILSGSLFPDGCYSKMVIAIVCKTIEYRFKSC